MAARKKDAVAEKQKRDDSEFAALVSRGTATVAVKTGADGGMHPTFLAKLKSQDQFDNGGRIFSPDADRLGEYVVEDFLRTRRAVG